MTLNPTPDSEAVSVAGLGRTSKRKRTSPSGPAKEVRLEIAKDLRQELRKRALLREEREWMKSSGDITYQIPTNMDMAVTYRDNSFDYEADCADCGDWLHPKRIWTWNEIDLQPDDWGDDTPLCEHCHAIRTMQTCPDCGAHRGAAFEHKCVEEEKDCV